MSPSHSDSERLEIGSFIMGRSLAHTQARGTVEYILVRFLKCLESLLPSKIPFTCCHTWGYWDRRMVRVRRDASRRRAKRDEWRRDNFRLSSPSPKCRTRRRTTDRSSGEAPPLTGSRNLKRERRKGEGKWDHEHSWEMLKRGLVLSRQRSA